MNKRIILIIARMIFTALVFTAALLITSGSINRSQPEDFVRMEEALFPCVSLMYGGREVNLMHGYAREMDVAAMKGPLFVAGEDRHVDLVVDGFGTTVESASFEIRTTNGQNLVEQTPLSLSAGEEEGKWVSSLTAKDLIEYDREYMLVIVLTFGDQTARYYCRLTCATDETPQYLEDHIAFALGFHEDTFTRPASADAFLETDAAGRDDTFEHVTIHSGSDAVSFKDINVTARTEPLIEINDTHHRYASLSLRYNITITTEEKERDYHVVEEYFTRRGNDGMYLIDFERRLNYVFEGKKEEIEGSTLDLSFLSDEVPFMESDSGNVFAFVNEGRLFVCQQEERRITRVYGFYDNADTEDVRTAWQGAKIKILRVDASGSVIFRVKGYMNRGRHEGETGTLLLSFDPEDNAVSELVFIDSDRPEEILIAEEDITGYVNHRGVYYTVIGRDLYAIDLYEGGVRVAAKVAAGSQVALSAQGEIIAWQDAADTHPTQIRVLDMRTETTSQLDAGDGESLRLLGFIGTDIIYGAYDKDRIITDELKGAVYPMHRIVIASAEGAPLTVYEAGEYAVTDVTVEETRVILHRIQEGETSYTQAADDQIMSTAQLSAQINTVTRETVAEGRGVRTQIVMSVRPDREKTRFLSAQEALPDAIRTDISPQTSDRSFYYCMDHRHVAGIYAEAAGAVSAAYHCYGYAVDETNRMLYYRGNQTTRNQIMTLTALVERTDFTDTDSASACLQAMLDFEGAGRNAQKELEAGAGAAEILQEALPGMRVLDLTGCPIEVTLHYVDLMYDIPVMAAAGDGEYVLLLGFNESEVVFFNPQRATENVYKVSIAEARRLFEENGNRFLTYVR